MVERTDGGDRRGVGKVLYQTFEEDSRSAGCTRLKAITTSGNSKIGSCAATPQV